MIKYVDKIKQGKSPDGYLQLSWENPVVPYAEIDYYTISSYYYEPGEIISPENPVYVDKEYLYGYKDFRITVYFKNNKLDPAYFNYSVQYNRGDDIKFTYEPLKKNKLKISWSPHEYRCKYVCDFYYGDKIIETTDNYIIIDQIRFPTDNFYVRIYLLHTEEEYEQYQYYDSWASFSYTYECPTMMDGYFDINNFEICDFEKKTFLSTTNANDLYFYNLNSFTRTNHIAFNNPFGYWSPSYTCSWKNNSIAFFSEEKILLYSDISLTSPISINYGKETHIKGVMLSSNNSLYCLSQNSNDQSCKVKIHNASTGELIQTHILEKDISYIQTVYFSKDGKYLFFTDYYSLFCYKLNTNSIEKMYQRNLSSGNDFEIIFNPLNSEEAIIRPHHLYSFKVVKTEDFSEIKAFDGYNPSFDPYTGKLVYTVEDNYYNTNLVIVKPETYDHLLSIPTSDSQIIMIDVYLITSSDHYTHIDNF